MSGTIEDLKRILRARLLRDFRAVPPKTQTSEKRHLEVWQTAFGMTRHAGLEFGHQDRVNIWVTAMNVPASLPNTIQRTDKAWQGDRHVGIGSDEKGANSNLKSYDAFRGKKVTRLGVTNLADAELILEHLTK